MTHFTDEQLHRLLKSGAPSDEQIAHLAECEPCMQRYCDTLETDGQMLCPPPDMKQDIQTALQAKPVWNLPPTARFCAAATAAILLWCSGVFHALPEYGLQVGQYTQEISASIWQAEQKLHTDRLEQRSKQEEPEASRKRWALPFIQDGGI